MAFFNSAVGVLQTLVIALGAGLGIWGAINLLDPELTDTAKCMCCMACTAVCPTGARRPDAYQVDKLLERLGPMMGKRKENELFV